jgi:hypothetical protein
MMTPVRSTATMLVLGTLVACGGGGGGGSGGGSTTSNSNPSVTASGQITDFTNGASIAGAQVDIPLKSTNPQVTSTADGRYSLSLPQSGLPQFLAGTVNKAHYLPGTVLFQYTNGQLQPLSADSNNVALVPVQDMDVVFFNGLSVTHLGDAAFTGVANSQFQVPASSLIWNDSFNLTAAQKQAYSSLKVTLYARGVESATPSLFCDQIVLGNTIDAGTGKVTGVTPQILKPSNSDGSFTKIEHVFLLSDLAADQVAHLQILSGKQCANPASDYDDFEIATVMGELSQ